MSIEYHERGALHKLTSTRKFRPQQSKNTLVKWTAKTALAAETTALFAKDLAVNRFVGKETHIKFERMQNQNGDYQTHIKFVRAEADRPSGVLHKFVHLDRFVEGDTPFNSETKFNPRITKAVLLTSETALTKASTAGLRHLQYKLRNNSDIHDSGKAVLTGITAVQKLNHGRKYLINYRRSRAIYQQKKLSYDSHKQQFHIAKNKYKSAEQADKDFEKAVYKNSKKQKKFSKKEANRSKVIPVAAMPLVPSAALVKQLGSTYGRKLVYADTDNDFMQAAEKISRGAITVNRTSKQVKNKLHDKHSQQKKNRLYNEHNRLNSKKSKSKKIKRKHKKNQQKANRKASEKAKQATKKAAEQTKKAIGNFVKFAIKLFGIFLIPIIVIVIIFAMVMLTFSGIADNNSYILGTYNAEDRYLSYAIEHYTEIAYEFNENLIKCGKSNEWRNGLKGLGVSSSTVSSYKDTPNTYQFGKSSRFSQSPSYDFDPDKLAAFMCAYYYEPDDEGNIANWEWDDDYDDVLQELFDTEYTFAHYYEDFSGWKELSNYVYYEGGGARAHAYYTVEDSISTSEMKIKGVPTDISQFCKDDYLHYDYDTLEVLDANNHDKRTGYFIQDQRFMVTDPSGHKKDPFYSAISVSSREVFDKYAHSDGKVHFHIYGSTGVIYDKNGKETNYIVNDVNASTLKYSKLVWEIYENGKLVNKDRSDWYWTSDLRQIFCAVSPSDTVKWNSTLKSACLINFYKKNYWYDNCALYYTVKKNCTFEKAIKTVISNKNDNTKARLDFYQILTEENEEGHQTYGNHQMMNAPVLGKSMQSLNKKIYNNYGYDIQEWNKVHCSGLTGNHTGMDILANSGEKVYAMFDGEIDDVDTSDHTLSLTTTEDMDFWYCDNHTYPVEAIYSNIKATVKEGDTVKQGQVIGKVTTDKRCYDDWDIHSSKNYLHITVKIIYDKWYLTFKTEDPIEVDPRLLIYRNDGEAK